MQTKQLNIKERWMLTRKQYELLMFIHGRLQDSGVSPSFDEMKEALAAMVIK